MSRNLLKLIVAFAVLMVSGCASLGRSTPVPDHVLKARELSQQGVVAFHRGRWQVAMDKLKAAVMTCPSDCGTRKTYANMLSQNGDISGAIAQLESAIESDATDDETLVELARLYLQNGNAAKASSLADEAIANNANLASAWSVKGRALQEIGHTDRALEALQRSVAHGDKSLDTHLAIAEIYQRTGRPRRCLTTIQALTENISDDQVSPRILHLKGMALASLDRHDDAASAMKLAASSR